MVTPAEAGFLADPGTSAQHFTLEAGDVAYVPRGVVHEAGTRVQDGQEGDRRSDRGSGDPVSEDRHGFASGVAPKALDGASLHLTFGLETATHHSVEVFLHNLVATHAHLLRATLFVSDDGQFTFMCGAAGVSESVEDCVHLVLAAIAGFGTPAGALLRRAVGTTVGTVDVAGLDPEVLVPKAVRAALLPVDLGQILDFLHRRGLLRVVRAAGVGHSAHSSDTSVGRGNHLSADRGCHFLDRFMGPAFFAVNRTVGVGTVWDSGDATATLVAAVRSTWAAAAKPMQELLTVALLGDSPFNPHKVAVSEQSFCAAFERMSADIAVDRADRRRMDAAALAEAVH
jgi:hypothetical protein